MLPRSLPRRRTGTPLRGSSFRSNYDRPPPRNGRYGYWNPYGRYVPYDDSPVRPAMWRPPVPDFLRKPVEVFKTPDKNQRGGLAPVNITPLRRSTRSRLTPFDSDGNIVMTDRHILESFYTTTLRDDRGIPLSFKGMDGADVYGTGGMFHLNLASKRTNRAADIHDYLYTPMGRNDPYFTQMARDHPDINIVKDIIVSNFDGSFPSIVRTFVDSTVVGLGLGVANLLGIAEAHNKGGDDLGLQMLPDGDDNEEIPENFHEDDLPVPQYPDGVAPSYKEQLDNARSFRVPFFLPQPFTTSRDAERVLDYFDDGLQVRKLIGQFGLDTHNQTTEFNELYRKFKK